MPHTETVVLLSGGIDSALVAMLEQAAGRSVYPLCVHYGQRHAWELRSADRVARALTLPACAHASIGWPGRAPLLRSAGEPLDAPAAVVTARNAALLCLAVAHAQGVGARRVAIGCVRDDAEAFLDCRPAFLEAMRAALSASVEWPLDLAAPLVSGSKADAVRRAYDLCGADHVRAVLALTWSCYSPVPINDPKRLRMKPCGACAACALRARTFLELGESDPAAS